jgi:hypothetical protein
VRHDRLNVHREDGDDAKPRHIHRIGAAICLALMPAALATTMSNAAAAGRPTHVAKAPRRPAVEDTDQLIVTMARPGRDSPCAPPTR